MKQNLIFIMLTLVLQGAVAQDYIVKVNGEEIQARVLEINLEAILYQQPDSTAIDTLQIPKAEVFMVRFENGTKEIFTQSLAEKDTGTVEALSPEQLYQLGTQDAIQYYKGNGVLWGSAATTALAFPYGLAGAVVLGIMPADMHSDKVSDSTLLAYPEYVRGYQKQAQKKRRRKALAGAGIGTVVRVVVEGIEFAAFLSVY